MATTAKPKRKRSTHKLIGAAGVDAGMLLIGDPCYFIGEDCEAERKYGRSWRTALNDFHTAFGEAGDFAQLTYVKGHPGLGVVVDVDGDGTYPIEGIFRDGKLVEIRIKLA